MHFSVAGENTVYTRDLGLKILQSSCEEVFFLNNAFRSDSSDFGDKILSTPSYERTTTLTPTV